MRNTNAQSHTPSSGVCAPSHLPPQTQDIGLPLTTSKSPWPHSSHHRSLWRGRNCRSIPLILTAMMLAAGALLPAPALASDIFISNGQENPDTNNLSQCSAGQIQVFRYNRIDYEGLRIKLKGGDDEIELLNGPFGDKVKIAGLYDGPTASSLISQTNYEITGATTNPAASDANGLSMPIKNDELKLLTTDQTLCTTNDCSYPILVSVDIKDIETETIHPVSFFVNLDNGDAYQTDCKGYDLGSFDISASNKFIPDGCKVGGSPCSDLFKGVSTFTVQSFNLMYGENDRINFDVSTIFEQWIITSQPLSSQTPLSKTQLLYYTTVTATGANSSTSVRSVFTDNLLNIYTIEHYIDVCPSCFTTARPIREPSTVPSIRWLKKAKSAPEQRFNVGSEIDFTTACTPSSDDIYTCRSPVTATPTCTNARTYAQTCALDTTWGISIEGTIVGDSMTSALPNDLVQKSLWFELQSDFVASNSPGSSEITYTLSTGDHSENGSITLTGLPCQCDTFNFSPIGPLTHASNGAQEGKWPYNGRPSISSDICDDSCKRPDAWTYSLTQIGNEHSLLDDGIIELDGDDIKVFDSKIYANGVYLDYEFTVLATAAEYTEGAITYFSGSGSQVVSAETTLTISLYGQDAKCCGTINWLQPDSYSFFTSLSPPETKYVPVPSCSPYEGYEDDCRGRVFDISDLVSCSSGCDDSPKVNFDGKEGTLSVDASGTGSQTVTTATITLKANLQNINMSLQPELSLSLTVNDAEPTYTWSSQPDIYYDPAGGTTETLTLTLNCNSFHTCPPSEITYSAKAIDLTTPGTQYVTLEQPSSVTSDSSSSAEISLDYAELVAYDYGPAIWAVTVSATAMDGSSSISIPTLDFRINTGVDCDCKSASFDHAEMTIVYDENKPSFNVRFWCDDLCKLPEDLTFTSSLRGTTVVPSYGVTYYSINVDYTDANTYDVSTVEGSIFTNNAPVTLGTKALQLTIDIPEPVITYCESTSWSIRTGQDTDSVTTLITGDTPWSGSFAEHQSATLILECSDDASTGTIHMSPDDMPEFLTFSSPNESFGFVGFLDEGNRKAEATIDFATYGKQGDGIVLIDVEVKVTSSQGQVVGYDRISTSDMIRLEVDYGCYCTGGTWVITEESDSSDILFYHFLGDAASPQQATFTQSCTGKELEQGCTLPDLEFSAEPYGVTVTVPSSSLSADSSPPTRSYTVEWDYAGILFNDQGVSGASPVAGDIVSVTLRASVVGSSGVGSSSVDYSSVGSSGVGSQDESLTEPISTAVAFDIEFTCLCEGNYEWRWSIDSDVITHTYRFPPTEVTATFYDPCTDETTTCLTAGNFTHWTFYNDADGNKVYHYDYLAREQNGEQTTFTISDPIDILGNDLSQFSATVQAGGFNKKTISSTDSNKLFLESTKAITFAQPTCQSYTWKEQLDSFDHTIGDASLEVTFEVPSLDQEDSNLDVCLETRAWSYTATLEDGNPLPESITFDAEAKKLTIADGLETETKTYEVVIKASFEGQYLDTEPLQSFLSVQFIQPNTFISVTPSLAGTYEIKDDQVFSKTFTFTIEPESTELVIEMERLSSEDNAILSVELEAPDQVKITVDGTIAFVDQEDPTVTQRLVSVKMTVNGQAFTLNVAILRETNEDEPNSQTEETEVEEVESIEDDIDEDEDEDDDDGELSPEEIEEQLKELNPLQVAMYKIYGFLDRKKPERAPGEPEPIEIETTLSEINEAGQITITFDPPVAKVPDDWQQVFNETERSKLPKDKQKENRKLARRAIDVSYYQRSYEKEQEKFFANLTEFTPAGIKIQLSFSDPLLVSQGESADQVEIFLMKSYFLDPQPVTSTTAAPSKSNKRRRNLSTKFVSKKNHDSRDFASMRENLPMLVPSQEVFTEISTQAQSTAQIFQAQFLSSFFLQLFLSGALSMLWNIFNTLQIFIAFELFMVKFPANITIIIEHLVDIINFQLIPKEVLYDNLIVPLIGGISAEEQEENAGLVMEQKTEEKHGEVRSEGLLHRFMGTNILMDALMVIMALLTLITIVLLILACKKLVLPRCPIFCRSLVDKLMRKLMWNSFMRAILESYLSTAIFVWVSFTRLDGYAENGKIEVVVTWGLLIFLVVFPFGAWFHLFNNYDKLETEDFKGRFDSLYLNVDPKKGPIALSSMLLFCLRRLFIAYMISYVQQTIVFQVLLADFFTLFILCYYYSVRPMIDSINNYIMVFNELMILLAVQMLFLFTNYVGDPVIRYEFGFYIIYLVAFNMAANVTVLIALILRSIYKSARMWYLKRRARAQALSNKVKAEREQVMANWKKIVAEQSRPTHKKQIGVTVGTHLRPFAKSYLEAITEGRKRQRLQVQTTNQLIMSPPQSSSSSSSSQDSESDSEKSSGDDMHPSSSDDYSSSSGSQSSSNPDSSSSSSSDSYGEEEERKKPRRPKQQKKPVIAVRKPTPEQVAQYTNPKFRRSYQDFIVHYNDDPTHKRCKHVDAELMRDFLMCQFFENCGYSFVDEQESRQTRKERRDDRRREREQMQQAKRQQEKADRRRIYGKLTKSQLQRNKINLNRSKVVFEDIQEEPSEQEVSVRSAEIELSRLQNRRVSEDSMVALERELEEREARNEL